MGLFTGSGPASTLKLRRNEMLETEAVSPLVNGNTELLEGGSGGSVRSRLVKKNSLLSSLLCLMDRWVPTLGYNS